MEPLRVDHLAPARLRITMQSLGAEYLPARSNSVRHIYFSRRLNRWFAVSTVPGGMVKVSQYAECPCGART